MTDSVNQLKWDARFIHMAEFVAQWSKDPSTKTGAVIVRPDKTVASVGFNGFPAGVKDDDEFYENREEKYGRVIHAEVNAILHAREPLHGYTMYTWPGNYAPSCDRCTAAIIQAGIKRVAHVYDTSSDFAGRWRESQERGLQMYSEAGIEVAKLPQLTPVG
jgi:dCMP deaminase